MDLSPRRILKLTHQGVAPDRGRLSCYTDNYDHETLAGRRHQISPPYTVLPVVSQVEQ